MAEGIVSTLLNDESKIVEDPKKLDTGDEPVPYAAAGNLSLSLPLRPALIHKHFLFLCLLCPLAILYCF